MTSEEFRAARHQLGLSANGMARLLGLSDGRTVRKYEAGDRPISEPIARLVMLALSVPAALRALSK